MRLSRWLALIALLVGLGCLQVSQRNAIYLKGYALGERVERMHAQETQTSWLRASVVGLESPTRLAVVAQEQGMPFEARRTVSSAPGPAPAEPALQLADGR